ncbi:MAG TPA: hypothetical protein VMB52_01720 [Verrucomicrobiae bacterium]|nr:hypothetical protein [Verrucomicrobiae bacterium]
MNDHDPSAHSPEAKTDPDQIAAERLRDAIRDLPRFRQPPHDLVGENVENALSGVRNLGTGNSTKRIERPERLPSGVTMHFDPDASETPLLGEVGYGVTASADSLKTGERGREVANVAFMRGSALGPGGGNLVRTVQYSVLLGGEGTDYPDRSPVFVDKFSHDVAMTADGHIFEPNPRYVEQHDVALRQGVTTPAPEEVDEVTAYVADLLDPSL